MRLAAIVAVVVSLGVGAGAVTARTVSGAMRGVHVSRASRGRAKAMQVPKMPKGMKPYHGSRRRTVRGRA